MKKTFFRPATAVLLALIMAIIPLSTVLASNSSFGSYASLTPGDALTNTDVPATPDTPVIPATPDTPTPPDEPDDPVTPADPSDSDIVGTISIAFRMSKISFGHVWIYIHNTSDEPLEVGLYTVQPGEGVSLGNFNITRNDGPGLYYNIESYCGNLYGLDGTASVSDELTRGRLNLITKLLRNVSHFDPIYNCTGFALTVWNLGSKRIMPFIPIPVIALVEIILWGGRFNNLEMSYPPADQVYKQRGIGEKAYLEPVCEASLEDPV